jgi:integrase
VNKEALRNDEVQIVLCPRHGNVELPTLSSSSALVPAPRSESTLHPHDIQSVLKVARRERYDNRAELLVVLSTTLGLRASELTRIAVKDVYARDGSVLGI